MGCNAQLTLALLVGLGAAQTILLDDTDETLDITKTNVAQGSFAACADDAYNKQFHHDSLENEGQSRFSFTFEVARSGCYVLQEYHPGANESCRRHLPQNVFLRVDYCRGRTSTLYYDQSDPSKLGRWNTLGAWMFFTREEQGKPGRLTVKSHDQEVCLAGAGQCTMVVDAFRLKRIGHKCKKHQEVEAYSPVSLPEVDEEQQQGGLLQALEEEAEGLLEHEGLLKLQVSGASRSYLWFKRATISITLETHYSLTQVRILGLEEVTGRRLASGPAAADFEVRFAARSEAAEVSAVPGFAQALQAALDTVGADAQVLSADVDFEAVYPAESLKVVRPNATSDAHASVLLWALPLAGGALLLALLMALLARTLRARGKASAEGPAADTLADAEAAEGKKPADTNDQSKEAQWENNSVSTGSPDGEASISSRPSDRSATSELAEPPAGTIGMTM